jgi:hypothetical protein
MEHTHPRPSDLVILKRTHFATIFVAGSDQDQPQLSLRSFEEALSYAQRAAEKSGVDVWYTNDGSWFERVARYRQSI